MLTTQNNPWVKDFPILAADENGNRLVYLDSAATTQHPQQVLDAVLHYYQKDNANPHRGVYELAMRATDAHEGARHRVARFFGAEDDEIVFTQNTTESLNLVAYSYGLHFLHEGDEIVISVAEHHSNLVPWQRVAKATGAKLVYLYPGPDGHLTAEELDALGQSPSVQTFRAREASDLLTGLDADGLLPPSRRAAARAAVWDAFFRQNFELLPSTLPEALRSQSSSLLTDFAAQDYTLLGDILEFLVNRAAVFQSDALPGAWDRKAGTYTVTEASRAAVQTFLSVSPTEGQASSASEP